MGGTCSTNGKTKGGHEILVAKFERRRPLGIPRDRRRMILKGILKKQRVKAWNGFV
jgi:hypothetical protein